MQKLFPLSTILMLVLMSTMTMAQNVCCGGATVAPEATNAIHPTSIPLNQNTPVTTLSVNASTDLPTVEFLITKRGVLALNGFGMPDTTGGGGDVIIGAVDANGTFKPEDKMRSGVTLAAGDTFDLTAIGYDLAIIKELGDSLLNGTSNSQPCCGLFTVLATALSKPELAGFCDSVNNAGIYSANDINDAEDLLTIFDPFFSGQVSVGAVIWTLQIINSNGSFISTDCGGTGNNNFVPYGINRNQRYSYETGSTVMTTVNKLSAVTLFMLYPNPVTGKTLNLNFTTTQEVDLSIQVYDVLGQTVLAKNLGTVQGNFQTGISTEGLTSGVYTVALSDGNHTELRKVVIP